jgi:hypothetical protein
LFHQVNAAQLDAFRSENRHLRRSAFNMSAATNKSLNETVDLAETEAHMKELQSAYQASLGTLEVSVTFPKSFNTLFLLTYSGAEQQFIA